MRLHHLWSSALCVGLAVCSGACGKFVPVEGQVTYEGQPLDGAFVTFVPEEKGTAQRGPRLAHAVTAADGRFQLSTTNDHGAIAGKYKVTVSKMVYPPDAYNPDPEDLAKLMLSRKPGKETVPLEYTHPDKTPLRVEIPKEGRKDIILEIRSQSP